MVLSITDGKYNLSNGHTEITYKFCTNENSLISQGDSNNFHNASVSFTIPVEKPKLPPTVKFDKGVIGNFKEIIDWNKIVGEHVVYVEEKDAVVINNCAYFGKMILDVKTKAHFCETITLHYQFSSKEASCRHQPAPPRHANNGIKASGSLTLTPSKQEKPNLVTAIFDFGKPDNGKISNMDEIWEACPYVQPRTIYIRKEDAIGAGYFGEMLLNINKINTSNNLLILTYRITCLSQTAYVDGVSRNDRISGTVTFIPKITKELPILAKFNHKKVTNLKEIFGELKENKSTSVYVNEEDAVVVNGENLYGELTIKIVYNTLSHNYLFQKTPKSMSAKYAIYCDSTIKVFKNGLPTVTFFDGKPTNIDVLFDDVLNECATVSRYAWIDEFDAILTVTGLYFGKMNLKYCKGTGDYTFYNLSDSLFKKSLGNPHTGITRS